MSKTQRPDDFVYDPDDLLALIGECERLRDEFERHDDSGMKERDKKRFRLLASLSDLIGVTESPYHTEMSDKDRDVLVDATLRALEEQTRRVLRAYAE